MIAPTAAPAPSTTPDFNALLARAESIAREMERDDLDPQHALSLFQEAAERLRAAQAILDHVEEDFRRLLEGGESGVLR